MKKDCSTVEKANDDDSVDPRQGSGDVCFHKGVLGVEQSMCHHDLLGLAKIGELAAAAAWA
jgi:hypothetical protein